MSTKTTKQEDWKVRLKEERIALLEKTLKLKNFMDNPDSKLSRREWEMLNNQYYHMREYLQALTDRCIYYNIIEGGDLGIHY